MLRPHPQDCRTDPTSSTATVVQYPPPPPNGGQLGSSETVRGCHWQGEDSLLIPYRSHCQWNAAVVLNSRAARRCYVHASLLLCHTHRVAERDRGRSVLSKPADVLHPPSHSSQANVPAHASSCFPLCTPFLIYLPSPPCSIPP